MQLSVQQGGGLAISFKDSSPIDYNFCAVLCCFDQRKFNDGMRYMSFCPQETKDMYVKLHTFHACYERNLII